jgi:ssDNA-binding Zn-finger/Zn-ribbon topoisomerase 1
MYNQLRACVVMGLKCRVIFESYDELDRKVQSRDELISINIKKPETIDDIGLNYESQVVLIQSTLDKIIELQGPLINQYHDCPRCGKKVIKKGKGSCEVHAMSTEHKIKIQKYRCPDCDWTSSESIRAIYGTDVHTSLTKIQAELGSNHSFRKVVSILKMLSLDKKRAVNNKERIKRVVTAVGRAIEEYNLLDSEEAQNGAANLIVHIDGAHISTQEQGKRSFEAMTSTIFRPEDVKPINDQDNIIEHKIVIASAREDQQESMKKMVINAAKRAGMTIACTKVTGLSDGAANCKSIINALSAHCNKLETILDWFHISMKFQNIPTLASIEQEELECAKWKLWHGLAKECFNKLTILINKTGDKKIKCKLQKLLEYLVNNEDILVNYGERKVSNLPFTSNIAESTVENLVNSRYRQTGKMQWKREGAHALLQLRAASYSNTLSKMWRYVFSKPLKLIA